MSTLKWYNNDNAADIEELVGSIGTNKAFIVCGTSDKNIDSLLSIFRNISGMQNYNDIIASMNKNGTDDPILDELCNNSIYAIRYLEQNTTDYTSILTKIKNETDVSISSNSFCILVDLDVSKLTDSKLKFTVNVKDIYGIINITKGSYYDLYTFIESKKNSSKMNAINEELYANNYKVFYKVSENALSFKKYVGIWNKDETESLLKSLAICNYRPVLIWAQSSESDSYTALYSNVKSTIESCTKQYGIFGLCIVDDDLLAGLNSVINNKFSSVKADSMFYNDNGNHLIGKESCEFMLVTFNSSSSFSFGNIKKIYSGVGLGWNKTSSSLNNLNAWIGKVLTENGLNISTELNAATTKVSFSSNTTVKYNVNANKNKNSANSLNANGDAYTVSNIDYSRSLEDIDNDNSKSPYYLKFIPEELMNEFSKNEGIFSSKDNLAYSLAFDADIVNNIDAYKPIISSSIAQNGTLNMINSILNTIADSFSISGGSISVTITDGNGQLSGVINGYTNEYKYDKNTSLKLIE